MASFLTFWLILQPFLKFVYLFLLHNPKLWSDLYFLVWSVNWFWSWIWFDWAEAELRSTVCSVHRVTITKETHYHTMRCNNTTSTTSESHISPPIKKRLPCTVLYSLDLLYMNTFVMICCNINKIDWTCTISYCKLCFGFHLCVARFILAPNFSSCITMYLSIRGRYVPGLLFD